MEKQWTEKYLVYTIINFIDRYGCLPNESDFCEKNGLLGIEIYHKIFNMSLDEIFINYPVFRAMSKRKNVLLYETGWNKRNTWTSDNIKCAIEDFINRNGYFPRSIDFNSYNQLPSFKTFLKCITRSEFGQEERERLIENLNQYKKIWTKDTIIEAIRIFTKIYGRKPKKQDFNSARELPSCDILPPPTLTLRGKWWGLLGR